jgi:hypothetical protein
MFSKSTFDQSIIVKDFILNKFVEFMLKDESGQELKIKAFVIPSMSPDYGLILGIPAMKQLGLKGLIRLLNI